MTPGSNNVFGMTSASLQRARAALASGFGDSGTLLTSGRGTGAATKTDKALGGVKDLTGQ